MRPLLHGDISDAARALLAAPQTGRARLCQRMIIEAEAALTHVNHTGRLHPVWGNGSLMSAARQRRLAPEPGFDDLEYCRCMELVLTCLIAHHTGQTASAKAPLTGDRAQVCPEKGRKLFPDG
ncbi:MAG: hypothetical protein AAGF79_00620 [Pseudomonadota bacterium]